jgi:hypothetical protein
MEVSSYVQTARPGSRAPHVWLEDGRSLIDEFGREFVLLIFEAADEVAAGFEKAAAERGMPLRVKAVDSAEAAEAYAAPYVLVRPDGSVCWRGLDAPASPGAVLDVARGVDAGR